MSARPDDLETGMRRFHSATRAAWWLTVAWTPEQARQLRHLAPPPPGVRRLWVAPRDMALAHVLGDEPVTWAPSDAPQPRTALRAYRQAATLLRDLDIDRVVTAGTTRTVPFLLAARRHGVRTVVVERSQRILAPDPGQRLCYRMADLFLVQWPSHLALYPRAHLVGPVT